MTLAPGLAGPDVLAIVRALIEHDVVPDAAPNSVMVDARSAPSTDWIERLTAGANEIFVSWDDGAALNVVRDTIVKAKRPGYPKDPERVLGLLAELPFEIASFETIHADWYGHYSAPSFGDLHWPHGWACAFKGDGHRRLVSRRWLEFGPWRLLRGADGTSLVQFHDLEADSATALEQARPGHERLGISDVGGFIQTGYVYAHDLSGLYVPEERKLKFIVYDREISQREMLDAAAARYYQALGPDKPIDAVAYVFAEEGEARRYLDELWLRELECWAFADGVETRLDEDHRPTYSPPAWVKE